MELKIFSGRANPDLASRICSNLKVNSGKILLDNFSDGEIRAQYEENIRGADVFLIQPTCRTSAYRSSSENILELILMIDAARRASAKEICAVIPYFGYARQDRKDDSRVPISAKAIAAMIENAGATRVLTMDLHAGQMVGFFEKPVDHLYAKPVFVDYFKKNLQDKLSAPLIVMAPDVGAIKMARSYAKRLGENIPIAVVDKRRPKANYSEILNIVGEVEGKSVLIIDDIIDTAGTLAGSAKEAERQGAKQIFAFCAHGVFSGDSANLVYNSPIEKLFITDTIPFSSSNVNINNETLNIGSRELGLIRIEIISVAGIFAEAIKRIHEGQSVSSLFDNFDVSVCP